MADLRSHHRVIVAATSPQLVRGAVLIREQLVRVGVVGEPLRGRVPFKMAFRLVRVIILPVAFDELRKRRMTG